MATSPKKKDTFSIYSQAKRPRLGTIGKNHIQSSSYFHRTALFLCTESDTFLMNYTMNCITNQVFFFAFTAFVQCFYNSLHICKGKRLLAIYYVKFLKVFSLRSPGYFFSFIFRYTLLISEGSPISLQRSCAWEMGR